jgi:hypothetical protein
VFNPRQLRADQPYQLSRSLDGLFREFRYEIDASKFLRVVRRAVGGDGQPQFAVEVVEYPRAVQLVATSAEISKEHNSLSSALDAAGENIQLALALSDIFGGEVDFNSDLQRGDRFEVLFERVMRDGQLPAMAMCPARFCITADARSRRFARRAPTASCVATIRAAR